MNHRSLLGVVLLCMSVPLTAQETIKIGTRVGMPVTGYEGLSRRDPFAPFTPHAAGGSRDDARAGIGDGGRRRVLQGDRGERRDTTALLEGPDAKPSGACTGPCLMPSSGASTLMPSCSSPTRPEVEAANSANRAPVAKAVPSERVLRCVVRAMDW
jgi:hypothetical protein